MEKTIAKPTILGMSFSIAANQWQVYQRFNKQNERDTEHWFFTKFEAEQKLKELVNNG